MDKATEQYLSNSMSAGYSEWQKCPICNGSGKEVMFYNGAGANTKTCSTCNGKRIISKKTGKPPQ